MASIIIRDLPDSTKEILRVQAAKSGLSLEAYTRHILQTASGSNHFIEPDICALAGRYFGTKHGVEIPLPERHSLRKDVEFFMIIILDTNVISELMRSTPEERVLSWINAHKASNLAITAIAIAEIQRGIKRLPIGKRQSMLQEHFLAFVNDAFSGRIFSFDEKAAYLYGDIAAEREKAGFNTDSVDLMIAAIAKSNNAILATRNVKDFKDCGIKVINPWD